MGNTLKIKSARLEDIKNQYEFGEKLGTGSFAVVKKATRKKDGMIFAIKIIKKKNLTEEELSTIDEEVEIMQKVKHENIVGMYEFYETSKSIFMVLEFLSGGELFERIVNNGQYSEKKASELTKDVALAIQFLHSNNIVHRDLKPENLIYQNPSDDSVIKITDFGLAKYLKSSRSTMSTACGTPGYVAPEILKNEKYGPKVDVWSIGVIIYILLCGFPPFYSENTSVLYSKIKRAEYNFPDPYWSDISIEAKDLITRLLIVDPKDRYSIEELLEHPWISKSIAPDKPLKNSYTQRLLKFNARRKLKNGIKMIMAVNRLKRVIESSV